MILSKFSILMEIIYLLFEFLRRVKQDIKFFFKYLMNIVILKRYFTIMFIKCSFLIGIKNK